MLIKIGLYEFYLKKNPFKNREALKTVAVFWTNLQINQLKTNKAYWEKKNKKLNSISQTHI